MYIWTLSAFVSDFNHNSKVSTNLVKILNKNFHSVHSETVELVHAGRPTYRGSDMTKLIFLFRNGVVNAPKVRSAQDNLCSCAPHAGSPGVVARHTKRSPILTLIIRNPGRQEQHCKYKSNSHKLVLNSKLSMQQIHSVQCTKSNGRIFLGEKIMKTDTKIWSFVDVI
jgi:hypothetical protein